MISKLIHNTIEQSVYNTLFIFLYNALFVFIPFHFLVKLIEMIVCLAEICVWTQTDTVFASFLSILLCFLMLQTDNNAFDLFSDRELKT